MISFFLNCLTFTYCNTFTLLSVLTQMLSNNNAEGLNVGWCLVLFAVFFTVKEVFYHYYFTLWFIVTEIRLIEKTELVSHDYFGGYHGAVFDMGSCPGWHQEGEDIMYKKIRVGTLTR